jgi:hypothetical protein
MPNPLKELAGRVIVAMQRGKDKIDDSADSFGRKVAKDNPQTKEMARKVMNHIEATKAASDKNLAVPSRVVDNAIQWHPGMVWMGESVKGAAKAARYGVDKALGPAIHQVGNLANDNSHVAKYKADEEARFKKILADAARVHRENKKKPRHIELDEDE